VLHTNLKAVQCAKEQVLGTFVTDGECKALPPIPAVQDVANELGPAFGQWTPAGTREFSLTSYAVMGKAGLGTGFQRIQYTLFLSESGDEYTGHAEVDFLDADWNVVFSTVCDLQSSLIQRSSECQIQAASARQRMIAVSHRPT
jgi:hypothetical protein